MKILVIDKIQYIFVKKDYIWVNLSLIKSGDASKGEQDLPLYGRIERVYRILKMLVRDWTNLFWNVHCFSGKDYLIGSAYFAQQNYQ